MKKMFSKGTKERSYYDKHSVVKDLLNEPVEMSLENRLKEDILLGKRRRKLKNISIRIDPLQIQAIKKVATMKSVPYQTLIRHWLSENIRRELHIQ